VLPDGAVLLAGRQTSGRGRGGNVWTSPPGCLMFTALRRLTVPGEAAPFINYVVCLAVVRGIRDATKDILPVR
jgi:biotin---protein ligase